MAKNNEKFVSRENAKTLWGYMVDLLTGKYTKPSGGIPKSDLESSVQTSLGKADTALQTFTETDPTVPSWAKQTNKPSYNADEISSTGTTNQFVTDTEKNTWNGKGTYSKPSGGIPKTDLASAVQTSLGKADSALQSETDPTVPSWAKQTNKPTYNSDEISDTNRTHKFATAAQLTQINTNQTNILYGIRSGAKNLVNLFNTISSRSCTATELENGGMKLSCTNAVWTQYFVNINLKPNTEYVLYTNLTNFSGTSIGAISFRVQYIDERGNLVQYKPAQTGEHVSTFTTESTTDLKLSVLINDSDTARTQSADIWVMICEKVVYDADSSYQPYALPNSDLTYLEAEDRAALAEEIDAGAKNKLQILTSATSSSGHITGTSSNGVMSVSFSSVSGTEYMKIADSFSLPVGTYVLSGLQEKTSDLSSATTYYLHMEKGGSLIVNEFGEGAEFTVTNASDVYALYVAVTSRATGSPKTIKPMLATKAAFGVSQKFVSYRMPYDKLTGLVYSNTTQTSSSYTLLDDRIYFINVVAYSVFYSAILFKYNSTNIYIHVLNSTNNYTDVFAITTSGNTVTITAVDGKWHVCKINKLG